MKEGQANRTTRTWRLICLIRKEQALPNYVQEVEQAFARQAVKVFQKAYYDTLLEFGEGEE